ncbi:MAG: hypothetical protein PQJ46_17385 [Spirochaetales bacterium]|nr:hypothetical protein [Spirochaetales bacterium]
MEIERKFLLSELPQAKQFTSTTNIKQGYLSATESKEVRIRQKGLKYYLTVKSGKGLERAETEISVLRTQFKKLWPATKGLQLEKIRYELEYNGQLIEIDEYKGELTGLFTAEIEFNSVKEALTFQPPKFCIEEITYDPRFKNRKLAETDKSAVEKLINCGKNEIEIGTIPYIIKDGEIKVVIITSRKSGQWIFPKGQPEKDLSSDKVALMEAKEEAGIEGEITAPPIIVPYTKGENVINMKSFPIKIDKLCKTWEESKERKRKLVSIEEALELSTQKAVHCGLKYLEMLI